MITDACPECESDQLDLQALTFAKLAPMDLGRIDIRYRRRALHALIWAGSLHCHASVLVLSRMLMIFGC
jgi:expansin (peptidoglycan-binding protein)